MPFPIEQQKKDLWCWAAIAVSVDRYFSKQSQFSQCKVASAVLQENCCKDPAACDEPAKLQDALEVVHRHRQTLPRPLTFKEIQEEIDANLPVCVRVAWREGGAHFVAITGYEVLANGEERIRVDDPLFMSASLPYEEFRTAYLSPEDWSAGGEWTGSYLVTP